MTYNIIQIPKVREKREKEFIGALRGNDPYIDGALLCLKRRGVNNPIREFLLQIALHQLKENEQTALQLSSVFREAADLLKAQHDVDKESGWI